VRESISHAYVDDTNDSNASLTILMNTETNKDFIGGQADLIQLITQKLYKNPLIASAFTDMHHSAHKAVDVISADGQPVVDVTRRVRVSDPVRKLSGDRRG
jgi:hypothetical protein